MRRPLAALGLAVSFLTIVPVRLRPPVVSLGGAAAWFPAVGAALGAVAGLVAHVAAPALGPWVAAVLAVATLVVLTGALHLDGLADCADALGARGGPQRRLAVMRDSSIGVFGALALLLWLALLVSAVATLDRGHALRALPVAAATGRWAALLHGAATPPARGDGLGAGLRLTAVALIVATVAAAAVALAVAGVLPGLCGLAAGAAVAVLTTGWSRTRLGGRTGDTLGATTALAEAVTVVVLLGVL